MPSRYLRMHLMENMAAPNPNRSYRAIWISDIHLGFPGCSAEYLLDFLRSTQCEYLYLVGDIIDLWYMKKRLYWPQTLNNVIRAILGKAKRGTRVIYVPGNHDELFRAYDGTEFGNVLIKNEVVHITTNGQRLLVMHGDQFDVVVRSSRTLSLIGTKTYNWLLQANHFVNLIRRKLGLNHWSLACFMKHKVKNAVQYMNS